MVRGGGGGSGVLACGASGNGEGTVCPVFVSPYHASGTDTGRRVVHALFCFTFITFFFYFCTVVYLLCGNKILYGGPTKKRRNQSLKYGETVRADRTVRSVRKVEDYW